MIYLIKTYLKKGQFSQLPSNLLVCLYSNLILLITSLKEAMSLLISFVGFLIFLRQFETLYLI